MPSVQYETLGLDGRRLLILGESHYESTLGEVSTNAQCKLTWDVIERAIRGDAGYSFYSKVESAVLGRALNSPAPSLDFWKRVAFYNFVPRLLETSGERPSRLDLQNGATLFFELLRLIKPNAVLVTGVTVWNAISKFFPAEAQSTQLNSDLPSNTWRWERLSLGPILATWTVHPSYSGKIKFTDASWRGRVARFIGEITVSPEAPRV